MLSSLRKLMHNTHIFSIKVHNCFDLWSSKISVSPPPPPPLKFHEYQCYFYLQTTEQEQIVFHMDAVLISL